MLSSSTIGDGAAPPIPSSMLLLDLSPISSQIEAVSHEIRTELTEINAFFNDFFVQKKQLISTELQTYSQTLTENSNKIEDIKEQVRVLAEQKKKIHQGGVLWLTLELEKEQAEVSLAMKSVQELSDQKNKISVQLSELQRKIDEVSQRLKKERDLKSLRHQALAHQLAREKPEAEFFKSILGLDIEVMQKDLMKFVFTNVNPTVWTQPYYIVIDVSSEDYKSTVVFGNPPIVTECFPGLPEAGQLLAELNKHRNFYHFLKQVRRAFKSMLTADL